MNVADSVRVASALEHLGYQATQRAEDAHVIILNTCVVRQSAEDKAYGRLHSLRPLKEKRPDLVINLMGCLVGVNDDGERGGGRSGGCLSGRYGGERGSSGGRVGRRSGLHGGRHRVRLYLGSGHCRWLFPEKTEHFGVSRIKPIL